MEAYSLASPGARPRSVPDTGRFPGGAGPLPSRRGPNLVDKGFFLAICTREGSPFGLMETTPRGDREELSLPSDEEACRGCARDLEEDAG